MFYLRDVRERPFNLSNKSKGDPRVKYRKNYNLMHDGVHPIRTLAKLWAAKLVETALELTKEGC